MCSKHLPLLYQIQSLRAFKIFSVNFLTHGTISYQLELEFFITTNPGRGNTPPTPIAPNTRPQQTSSGLENGLRFTGCLIFEKIKYLYFFHFLPLGQDIDNYWFLPVFTFGWNHLKLKSLFPNDCTAISKVNNQHPSDILHFWGMIKS